MDPLSIIALVTASLKAGETLFQFAIKYRNRMKQDHELTPEEEAAFDQLLEEVSNQPHWKP